MQEKIYFYYTNDLHSDFTYWPNVVSYLRTERQNRIRKNESHFTVDIGDHVDRVNPIAEAFMGKGNVQLLNEANYDFATIGNNEGITLAHHELFHLYDDANFNVICSNLYSKTNTDPLWLERVTYTKTDSNVTIGILGLTAAFNPFYNLLDWHVEDGLQTVGKMIKQVKQQADIIVLLSHVGLHNDRVIAESFPEIDAIIGGHTHHLLKNGERVNNTILTAAGKHCAHVGEVILTWDHKRNQLINKEAYTTNITHLPKDEQTVNRIKELMDQAIDKLSTPITKVDRRLEVNWFKETPIIKQLTNTLQQWTKADIAMLNAGLLLEDLQAGTITYEDVHRICPHPINPVVVAVTGSELKEIVRVSGTAEFMNRQLKGFGFRGKVLGKMIFTGINVEYANAGTTSYVKNLYMNNELINDKATYSLATADMFIFGRLLPEVAKSEKKDLYLPELIRDLLAHTLRSNKAKQFK